MATAAWNVGQDSFWRSAGLAFAALYPQALSLFWLAPLTVALVVVPEFLQHVVEIKLGMFAGGETTKAAASSAQRMAFGYVKIAGLVLAFLATARFWWAREHGGRWWDLRDVAWGRLLLGLLLFFGVESAPELLEGRVDPAAYRWIGIGWTILLLPSLFLLLAGLFGDRHTSLAAMVRSSWPWLIVTALLAALAFAPASWLHSMNHRWAMGADPLTIWALMIFDSLLVGFMAGATGTALFLGYHGFSRARRSARQRDAGW